MSSQFNNCWGVEEQQTTNVNQDIFETDLEWEVMAATECEKIEQEFFTGGTKDESFGNNPVEYLSDHMTFQDLVAEMFRYEGSELPDKNDQKKESN